MKNKPLKITPIKGRPMLHWVGKKPLDVVRHFPAQLSESVGVQNPPAEPSYREFRKNGYNLLFHGDNKEILSSLLIAGFRGRIDLIYIDPPFDSGADYVRRVKLRGVNGNGNGNVAGAEHSIIEHAQYEDIWANDNYLQFMYERLVLMRELLGDRGSIYLHCDWHKNHHLRFLLDEVFGAENFRNEIIWCYHDKFATGGKAMDKNHDTILHYSKSEHFIGNEIRVAKPQTTRRAMRKKVAGRTVDILDEKGEKIYKDYSDKKLDDVWTDIGRSIAVGEHTGYPTQKKSELIERIVDYGSEDDSIILDCFCGSGTTAAVAEKLGRRWIAADLNRGAIQTTIKRLQGVMAEQNGDLLETKDRGFIHYRVNNYDYARQAELQNIIRSRYGIRTDRKDGFFDGTVGDQLAKIVDLNKPLTRLDIQIIKDEISSNRPDETRAITVFCNGSETGIIADLASEKNPINAITVRDIQQDGMMTAQPAQAEVTITKKAKQATVTIAHYISPTILARLDIDRTLFDEQIDDFRAQIDCVLIDTDYDGEHFKIVESDLPKKKTDFIEGTYVLTLPRAGATVAVKIVDMLGEEVLETSP